jgi:hypothetical protein
VKSTGEERYAKKKRRKQREEAFRQRKQRLRQMRNAVPRYVLYAGAGVAIAVAAVWVWSRPSLPPTSMAGHTEDLPGGYVLSTPMPEVIQKHMLEHAGGKGRPGVIIQYNCEDFDCAPDLVDRLAGIVRSYRGYVYLAPNTYDGKIILTRLENRLILNSFDEAAIRRFVSSE